MLADTDTFPGGPVLIAANPSDEKSQHLAAWLTACNTQPLWLADLPPHRLERQDPAGVILDVAFALEQHPHFLPWLEEQQKEHYLPLILWSALPLTEPPDPVRHLSVDEIIVWPVNEREFQRRVRSLLRLKAMHDQLRLRALQMEQRAMELDKMDRVNTDFTIVLSHELRTPLTPVMAYTELLLEGQFGPLTQDQREAVLAIQQNTNRMHELVETLLEFANLERGKLRTQLRQVTVESVLENEVRAIADRCLAKHIHLQRGWAKNLPKVLADPSQLRRVMRHLLDNAYKFTPEGGQIVVRAYPTTLPSATGDTRATAVQGVTITVEDTGIGIPEEHQRFIFNRFYQADSSLTRRYGGLGLGLALASRILKEHGASLEVQSKAGQGSAFSFTLAAASEKEERGHSGDAPGQPLHH